MIEQLKEKILEGGEATLQEILECSGEVSDSELFAAAQEVTQQCAPRRFDMCSIINARSGLCSENCAWCAQSAHFKTGVATYPLVSESEVVRQALIVQEQGVGSFSIVTSGHSQVGSEFSEILKTVKTLKQKTALKICASLGLLDQEQLRELKEVGVERYHCNLETAPSYFAKLCTTHTIDDKIKTLKSAHGVGMKICSGGIIGMGETMEQRIEMAFVLRELGVMSIPINMLEPISGTPMQQAKRLSQDEILRTMALFRLIHPRAHLRFAAGRRQLTKEAVEQALKIGMNAAIVGDMLTTLGSDVQNDKKLFSTFYEL